jgi:hypothetical protein
MVKRGRMNGLDAVAHTTVSLGTRPRRRLWALLLATTTLFVTTAPAIAEGKIPFDLVRSATAETGNCLLDAEGHVTVEPREGAEQMKVTVQGLPPNTAFNLFVTQLPNGPFGLSWCQGDIQTNSKGIGHGLFRGPSTSRPSSWPLARARRPSFIPARFPMRPATRRPLPCTCITSGCGSIRHSRRPRRDARPRSLRSTASTTPGSRRSAPGSSRTIRALCVRFSSRACGRDGGAGGWRASRPACVMLAHEPRGMGAPPPQPVVLVDRTSFPRHSVPVPCHRHLSVTIAWSSRA